MPQVIRRSSHPNLRLITYLLNSAVTTVKIIMVMAIHESKFNTGPRLSLVITGAREVRAVMLTAAMANVPLEYVEKDVLTSKTHAYQEDRRRRTVSCKQIEQRSLRTLLTIRLRW